MSAFRAGESRGFTMKGWRRRPDLNRGWRFCRLRIWSILLAGLVLWSRMMAGLPWCLGAIAPKLLRRFRGELQCLARHVGQFHTYPSARLCLFISPAVLLTFERVLVLCRIDFFR